MTRSPLLILSPGQARQPGGDIGLGAIQAIRKAARDEATVAGLTHTFYKYPARFSPQFVRAAIQQFSVPGDVVLDPYMGGGTTIVEAFAARRHSVGCDLNSLAVFVTRAKTTRLSEAEAGAIEQWSREIVPQLSYHTVTDEVANYICPVRTRNLSLPRARAAKKLLALALLSVKSLPTATASEFARAILLNVAQWALNNRKSVPPLSVIRARIAVVAAEMVPATAELMERAGAEGQAPILIHGTAETLPLLAPFSAGTKAKLVVTSPPYPGIHLLYHRWQIDGRKESPAPYWIADCFDGKGASFYNFADRREHGLNTYFQESLKTLKAIREVVSDNAYVVQMIAFSNPRQQLPRYLDNMEQAGFSEARLASTEKGSVQLRRIWRGVPNRTWYAAQKGETNSSREVVLIHRAR